VFAASQIIPAGQDVEPHWHLNAFIFKPSVCGHAGKLGGWEGDFVGSDDGIINGRSVGMSVGFDVGWIDGFIVGPSLGLLDGY